MSLRHYLHTSSCFFPFRVILSYIYGGLIWLRNILYDVKLFKTHHVNTPVISVGNISAGGSGKTVLVQALLEEFLDQGQQPAVLSRGYGRSSRGLVLVADSNEILASLPESGDEPFLIASNFPGVPVLVAEDRLSGARYLEEKFSPDVILLDDGFQHRRLSRDIDIVIIDFPETPKSHLLPRGVLREHAGNISRADVVVYSKKGLRSSGEGNLIFQLDPVLRNHSATTLDLEHLKGELGLFAGIGNPAHFFEQVESLSGPVAVKISFPDHAEYNEQQLDILRKNTCDLWITTQKDFIKLDPEFCKSNNVYYLSVKTPLPPVLVTHLKQHFN